MRVGTSEELDAYVEMKRREKEEASPKARQAGTDISMLYECIRDGGASLENIPGFLKRIIREKLFREFVHPNLDGVLGFDTFAEFVTGDILKGGLGCSLETVKRLCRDDAEAIDLIDGATRPTCGNQNRDPETGRLAPIHNNIMDRSVPPATQGTSAEYALSRLRDARPDIHARVIAGELSPHAGMLEAGFRRRTATVPIDDVKRCARALVRRLKPERARELAEQILEAVGRSTDTER